MTEFEKQVAEALAGVMMGPGAFGMKLGKIAAEALAPRIAAAIEAGIRKASEWDHADRLNDINATDAALAALRAGGGTEPHDGDVSRLLRLWAKPLRGLLNRPEDALALERAADVIESGGMDSVFTHADAPEGPWRAHKAAIEDWWEVERDGGAEYFGPRLFATKVEAIAVRDALNRVASQGEKPHVQ